MNKLLAGLALLLSVTHASAQCAGGYTQLSNVFACQLNTSSSFNFGTATILGGGGGSAGTVYAVKVTPSQTGTLRSLSVNLTGAAASMYLGLYDSDGAGGAPRTLLATTPTFSGVSGWNTVNVVAPHAVTSGHVYYLAVASQTNSVIANGGSGTVFWQSPVTTLPNPFTNTASFSDGISEYGTASIP